MTFKPMKNRVLIRPKEQEKVSAGGIILAPSVMTSTNDGVVIAVGSEVTDLKPGDVVGFLPFTGVKIKFDDIDYLVVQEDEVSFVVEGD